MPKRNLFEELKYGLENVKDYEQAKRILKTSTIKPQERNILESNQKKADIIGDYYLAKEVQERLNDGDEPLKVNIDEL